MKTTLSIYKNSKIISERNFLVEQIGSYLSSLSNTITLNNFQMLKFELSMKIKIAKEEYFALLQSNNYNYIKIETIFTPDDPEEQPVNYGTYYYFITHKQFLASNTVELTIEMDTLNTFCFNLTSSAQTQTTSMVLDKRTKVLREHKDRLTFVSKALHTVKCDREVDLYSEGLIPPLYKVDLNDNPNNPLYEVEINNPDNLDWYLIYAAEKEGAHAGEVNCYCVASKVLTVESGIGRLSIRPTDLETSVYYGMDLYLQIESYIGQASPALFEQFQVNFYYNMNFILSGNNNKYILGLVEGGYNKLVFKSNGTQIQVYYYPSPSYAPTLLFTCDEISFDQTPFGRGLGSLYQPTGINLMPFETLPNHNQFNEAYQYYLSHPSNLIQIYFYTAVSGEIDSFDNISLNDATIQKIIKLPYKPDYFGIDENYHITMPTRWSRYTTFQQDKNVLKLSTFSALLKSDVYDGTIPLNYRPLRPLVDISFLDAQISLISNRDDKNESKLFHSDYYQPKFIFDSFSFVYHLEKVNVAVSKTMADVKTWCNVNFCPTSTINSRFLFQFPNIVNKYETDDYPYILSVARNNEMTIYNSDYIDWIRSGYNYEVKSKERTIAKSWIGAGAAAAGAGALVGFSASPLKITGAIIGATAGLVSAIISTISAEESIQQKKANLLEHNASVYGSDDVDLYTQYTRNRAKYAVYSCSPRIKQSLADLFYYTGYISNEIKKPNLNTRMWFNFLQCEPVFTYSGNTTGEIVENVSNKLRAGITILHRNVISDVDTWDFEQEKENWEVALYNSVNV